MITADNLFQLLARSARSLRFVACIVALPLLLDACSGSGDSSDDNGPPATVLAWDAPAGATDVSGYRLYYGSAPGTYDQAPGAGIGVGNVTTYTVTGLNRATRIYFAVTAVDAQGNESGYSNEVFKDIP